MTVRMKCEKCGDETMYGLRLPCIKDGCDGERFHAENSVPETPDDYFVIRDAIGWALGAELDRIQSKDNPTNLTGIECSRIAHAVIAALKSAHPVPETPEAVREQAAKAFVVALHGGDAWEQWTLSEREAWLGVIDAIAPILRAADQQEIVQELAEHTKTLRLLDGERAEVARLTARLAEVEGAVREFQISRDAYLADKSTEADQGRYEVAKDALAALYLEAPRE